MQEVIRDTLHTGRVAQLVEGGYRGSMYLKDGEGVLYQEEMGHMGFTEGDLLSTLKKCEDGGALIGWSDDEFWMWKHHKE